MKSRTWIGVAALVALGGAGYAQQDKQAQKPNHDKTGSEMGAQDALLKPFELYKLDTLIGLDVQGQKSETLGRIDDLCINPRDGSIDNVVLSSGGVGGIGGTKRILPWRDLRLTPIEKDGDRKLEARVAMTEEQVKSLREFDKKAARGEKSEKKDSDKDKEKKDGERGVHAGVEHSLVTCSSDVKGGKLSDDAGSDLGEVEQVIVDTGAGRIAYVVLGAGGTLGVGEKHYALPWHALRVQRDADHDLDMRAALSKERLEKAPTYDADRWDATRSPEWMRNLYAYYSADPYWTGARPASSERTPGGSPANKPVEKQ